MRKKYITRCFAVLTASLILCACVAPAFALGSSDVSGRIFSCLPIDYYYFQNGDGPLDWVFNCSRFGSDVYYRYATYDNTLPGYETMSDGYLVAIDSASQDYLSGSFTGPLFQTPQSTPSNVIKHSQISLEIVDEVIDTTRLTNSFSIWYGGEGTLGKFHVYGNLYVPKTNDNGTVSITTETIDYSENIIYSEDVYLSNIVKSALQTSENYVNGRMAVSRLFIDFVAYPKNSYDNGFTIQVRDDNVSTTRTTIGAWFNNVVSSATPPTTPPPVVDTTGFNVGVFLGDTVSSFMNTPIWGEFTYGHIFGIALTLGVLFFALKLMV